MTVEQSNRNESVGAWRAMPLPDVSSAPANEVVLALEGVSKQYGAVQALKNVSLECRAGEIHAVVGENGAAKSTLLGTASGYV